MQGRRRLAADWETWLATSSETQGLRTQPTAKDSEPAAETDEAPSELFDRAYGALSQEVRRGVLERVRGLSPRGFEILVAQLLEAMGYGSIALGTIEVTGRSGDGGIDGRCSVDPLGVSTTLFQAKRWAASVGSPEVRLLVGALEARRVTRGLLVTTSTFTRDAIAEASHGGRVILVDGERLADLLLRYRVGARVKKSVEVLSVDEEFFGRLEAM